MLAENVNRASPDFKKESLVFRTIAFESTLPPHSDGAARRVSERIESYFHPQSEFLLHDLLACHCKKCGSSHTVDFATEVCILIAGRENMALPAAFVFPKLAICLKCGTVSDFQIPTDQLIELRRYVWPPQVLRRTVPTKVCSRLTSDLHTYPALHHLAPTARRLSPVRTFVETP